MEEDIYGEIKMGLTLKELIRMILEDWKDEVKDYSDEKLIDDRSYWMKNFGYPYSDDYDEENTLDGDIHTLTIELEQLRRFGEIIYQMPDGELKYDKKLKHNNSKKERITEE